MSAVARNVEQRDLLTPALNPQTPFLTRIYAWGNSSSDCHDLKLNVDSVDPQRTTTAVLSCGYGGLTYVVGCFRDLCNRGQSRRYPCAIRMGHSSDSPQYVVQSLPARVQFQVRTRFHIALQRRRVESNSLVRSVQALSGAIDTLFLSAIPDQENHPWLVIVRPITISWSRLLINMAFQDR